MKIAHLQSMFVTPGLMLFVTTSLANGQKPIPPPSAGQPAILPSEVVIISRFVGVRIGPAGGTTTTNCASSNDLLNLTMAYGSAGTNNGNLTGETIVKPLNIAQTITYDAYNRIGKATEGTAPAWSQTYNYDAYGNRWVTSPSGFPLYSFTPTAATNYNSNNQLAATFHTSAYDFAGNQTGIGGYIFTYDAENRQYTSAVNGTTTYTYDGEGRRVMKTTGTAQTVYVYDATGEVTAEYSTAAPPQVGDTLSDTGPPGIDPAGNQ